MILFVILIMTMYVAYLLKQYFSVWRFSEEFPGKKTLPLVGNSLQVGNNSHEYLQNLFTLTKKFKFTAWRTWIGPQLFIVISNPQDVEQILSSNKHLKKFQDYRFLHDWIGNGLITSSGNFWFRQRKLIIPSFHFKILTDFHLVMNKGINSFVSKLNKFADEGQAFDVQYIANLATLDVICESAMGVEVKALDNPDSPLVGAFHDISNVAFNRAFSAWKRFDVLFPLSSDYRKHKRAQYILHNFNDEIIQKRKLLLKKVSQNVTDPLQSDDNPKQRKAFLDTLLTTSFEGVPLTDIEISDEVSTFVFAGHDSTASAIAFGLYHLSIYPKEQQKVYEEQQTIFASDMKRDSTYQEIQDMKYLEAFIKESQRMISTIPFIGREALENIKLADGKIIPAGASVAVLLYAMGHNPDIFDKPDIFDPERFFADARSNSNPYEYVPFSAGPRNCIGQRFAQLELRTVFSKLVRHFEILTPKTPFEPIIAATATTISANGVYIRLKRRI